MTPNNETVSRQNFRVVNIAKSMTSEGNSALLPVNVDQRRPLQRGLTNFQLYNKSLKDWSLGKQLILFPSNLGFTSGNIEILGKQNQLLPEGPVMKCLLFPPQKVRMNVLPWLKNLWRKRRIYLFWNTGNYILTYCKNQRNLHSSTLLFLWWFLVYENCESITVNWSLL